MTSHRGIPAEQMPHISVPRSQISELSNMAHFNSWERGSVDIEPSVTLRILCSIFRLETRNSLPDIPRRKVIVLDFLSNKHPVPARRENLGFTYVCA